MYQVLARKYRPKNFHELLGQDHVAKALINAITHQRLHHAYLFTGTRGVGKTTIARILAKCLNCETGITSEPCGVCSVCQAIDSGRFIDLIEIDAASRTKVEDTRELLDNVPYAPTQGRYKVYLIDEVHMLSTHSFNALLKTLEEPPAHVKFLLATTDPQKLPITIISRCLQFVLRPLPQVGLADYLGTILDKEQISYQPDALWQLASSAKGSVRDALSLTDQAIAFGNGQITDNNIRQMLGLIDQADVIALLANVYQQNSPQLAQTIQQLREQVVDAKAVFDRLAEVLHQLAILQALPNFDLQIHRQQSEQLQQLARLLPAELLQLYYEIVIKSRENLALANTPMQALEMCILRLMAFKPLKSHQVSVQTNNDIAQSISSQQPANLQSATEAASHLQAPINEQYITTQTKFPVNDNDPSEDLDLVAVKTSSQAIEATNLEEPNNEINSITSNETNNVTLSEATNEINETLDESLTATQPNQQNDLLGEVSDSQNLSSQELSQPQQQQVSIEQNEIATSTDKSTCDSPIALLKPHSQQLTGSWSTEKWDYWVFEAREQGWLADDEIVLAKRGVMRGDIQGNSQFITDETTLSQSATFENFCQKLKQFFPEIVIQLTHSEFDHQLATAKPEVRQQAREQLAMQKATEQLQQQAVTQALLQQNASISSIRLIQ